MSLGSLRERARVEARSPRVALWIALAAALCAFCLIYGPGLVRADAPYWRNPHGDMGQMLAGELAGLREPWSLPLLVTKGLTAPEPVSLVYTDSIPWLTAILKLFHLGPVFSLLGTFLLIAWVAQAGAMYLLLRAAGVTRRSVLLVGALLALMTPSFLGRQIGHIALSGHALQILALALAVHVSRRGGGWWATAGFVGLGALAVGVHAYHVAPISLMLVVALASDVLQRRPGALRRALAGVTAYAVVMAATAWIVGYTVGRGASGGMAALGFYEMNMLAPVMPQGSWLAGHRWNGGWFTHVFDPTGGQVYEGYNYLGAGVLLLLTALASSALLALLPGRARARAADRSHIDLRRWGPLALACLLLTLYAVGPQGWLGSTRIWNLPLPQDRWAEPLALFRCHGRFFWTVGYALSAAALCAVDRIRSVPVRSALLGVALVLQAADVSGFFGALHSQFSRPEPLRVPSGLLSKNFRGRPYVMYPGYFCTASWMNQLVIRQLSIVAQRQEAWTTSAEVARAPAGVCERKPPAELLQDAAPGDKRITVLMSSDGGAGEVTSLFSRRSDCFTYGVAYFCGRDLAQVRELTSVNGAVLKTPEHLDATIALNTPPVNAALLAGWSKPESSGVWSEQPQAVLRLPHPELPAGAALIVTVNALGYAPEGRPPQRAVVSAAGRRLAEWRLDNGGYHGFRVAVPAALLRRGVPLDLVFDLPDSLSPNDVTPGAGDARRLGIGVKAVTLAH